MVVFNTAADSSGAMAELHRFRTETEAMCAGSINWHYVLGLAELPEGQRMRVRRFPWTKKNWLLRLIFDLLCARLMARKAEADLVVSLQNATVPCGHVPQILYVQLCFPFIKHRFPFGEFRLWLHQNLVGAFSIRSIRKADLVVVQNQWMRKACAERAHVDEGKIKILRQTFNAPAVLPKFEPTVQALGTFFYPATAKSYKNHRTLLDGAAIALRESGIHPRLVFTLNGDETIGSARLRDEVAKAGLTAEFRGEMTRECIFQMYSQSILVFPSLLETVGLPLVEAKAVGSVIIAYDAEYSRDVLRGYTDVHFFSDARSLAALLVECVEGRLAYHGGIDSSSSREGQSWDKIIDDFARTRVKGRQNE